MALLPKKLLLILAILSRQKANDEEGIVGNHCNNGSSSFVVTKMTRIAVRPKRLGHWLHYDCGRRDRRRLEGRRKKVLVRNHTLLCPENVAHSVD